MSEEVWWNSYCSKYKVWEIYYHERSIKPPGTYLILDTSEGGLLERGLIREGAFFKKLDEKDMYYI